eukprot:scaffold14325_cov75-Skeletonema_dohrnii-CCMP3373.AAC.2
MEENNSNNSHRRDDATKAILSRISNDNQLVEEVRQLLAENLQLRSHNNDSSNSNDATVANSKDDGASVAPTDSPLLSSDNVVVNNDKHKKLPTSSSSDGSKPQTSPSQNAHQQHKHPRIKDEEELAFTIDKDSEAYGNILSMAKWYRDSFFISANYANDKQQLRTRELEEAALRRKELQEQLKQKKKNRQIGSNTNTLRRYRPQIGSIMPLNDGPPLSSTLAMGHPLLLSIGENYIRSTYAVDLLRPYATWIVSKNGPLLTTASQSLAQTIPLGQASCDWAARDNLLWLLQDQEWRDFVKSITTRYINVDEANDGYDDG